MEREYCARRRYYLKKPEVSGIINHNEQKVVSVEELVERYFPLYGEVSKEDVEELRKTAFDIYQERVEQGYGLEQDPEENWRRAIRVCAIKKYLNERTT